MAITGHFTNVELPTTLQPGKQIVLRVNYTALNPGALYWSSCIMAKVGAVTTPQIVVTTREIGQQGGNWAGAGHQYNLGIMPNDRTTIKLRLLAHDDAGHTWSVVDWRD